MDVEMKQKMTTMITMESSIVKISALAVMLHGFLDLILITIQMAVKTC